MTMNFLPHEWVVDFKTSDLDDAMSHRASTSSSVRSTKALKLLDEKLQIPHFQNVLTRPRLHDLLDRSTDQFAATLVCGRAGTGKTVLAASHAEVSEKAAWYSIEPADRSWDVFASYFSAALFGIGSQSVKTSHRRSLTNREAIAEFLVENLRAAESELGGRGLLLVLDNIHHLYDTFWFADLFNQLIYSLQPNIHVLMLARSKPPAPLWRLRSKQMLNVVDEDVLEFTAGETEQLCKLRGLPKSVAPKVHTASRGRISKLIESLDEHARAA
jgi:ATP/maltotriose-dependent transcriptional regulator MalT